MRAFFEWLAGAGFVTPRFVREVIADGSGRKAHGIKVRIWAAAVFYFIIGVVVGSLFGAGVALAHPPSVLVANGSHEVIGEVYISSPNDEYWGENRLYFPLEPGVGVEIATDGHRNRCKYDVRAVFESGDEYVAEAVDLCEEDHSGVYIIHGSN